jgi:hypothetical protein
MGECNRSTRIRWQQWQRLSRLGQIPIDVIKQGVLGFFG